MADVIPSVRGRLVECVEADDKSGYVSLFAYAKGMLLADNGYRYREGVPLSEYFLQYRQSPWCNPQVVQDIYACASPPGLL